MTDTFPPALWDNSDPTYAPGLEYNGPYPRWKCPRRIVAAGYGIKSVKLDGKRGDGLDLERARRCRELMREAVGWTEDQGKPEPDTWMHLIARYKSDEDSIIHDVKGNTRKGYLELLALWENVIGHMRVADLTYSEVKKIIRAMQVKRSEDSIHRHFKVLKVVTRYGKLIGMPGAVAVKDMLLDLRLPTGKTVRAVDLTQEYNDAIVAEADRRGLHGFACGMLICHWYSLRCVDVRGHWIADEGEGGIRRGNLRWQDGLTWDMLAPDLSSFTKVISKTRKSMPEPYVFDLTIVPEIQDRLRAIGESGRVGPVILTTQGRPYDTQVWSRTFARIRDHLGLPRELTAMDARAGGITHAKRLGASPYDLRDAGQHKNTNTTDGYARDRSAGANNVVKLRRGQ